MIYEVIYTSAPSGLRPGSSGYCTVQSSRGIPAPTVEALESLSGYRHLFPLGHAKAHLNPVNYGHYIIRISGRREHVVSRVSDYELDYTGRSNKLAHHVLIDSTAVVPSGPAHLLKCESWMRTTWDGVVCQLTTNRVPTTEQRPPAPCDAWERAAGDAGWAGVLAESFLADSTRKVFLIYPLGTNVLDLFDEALALLPESKRWDVTFATYGAALPATVDCLWNAIPAGSPEVDLSRRFIHALRVDLTQQLDAAMGGPLIASARTGIVPVIALSTRSGGLKPPLFPRENFERDDESSKVLFESVPAVPTASTERTKPNSRREPPSLPVTRTQSQSRSAGGNQTPYLAAAIVVGLVITIGAAAILFLPRPSQPAKPAEIAVVSPPVATATIVGPHTSIAPTEPLTPWQMGDRKNRRDKEEDNENPDMKAAESIESDPAPRENKPVGNPDTDRPIPYPPEKTRTRVSPTVDQRPYAICTAQRKSVEKTDGSSKSTLTFNTTLSHAIKDARFLAPLNGRDRISGDFFNAEVTIADMPDRDATKITIFQNSFHLPDDPPWLSLTIPMGKDFPDAADFVTRNSDFELNSRAFKLAPAVPFGGCLFAGTRPIMLLFRSPPLQFPSVGYNDREHQFDLLATLDPIKSGTLRSELQAFEGDSPGAFRLHELAIKFPDREAISLHAQQADQPGFVAHIPDVGLEKPITIKVTPAQNSVAALKLNIDFDPNKSHFKTELKSEDDSVTKEWRAAGEADPRFHGVTDKQLDELERTVQAPMEANAQPSFKMTAEQGMRLIRRRRALIRRQERVKTFFETEVPAMELVSGRVTYRLMELGSSSSKDDNADRKTYDIDIVVIGDAPTDLDYHGWTRATKSSTPKH